MGQALADRGVAEVDGVTLDIGVSSMQLDRPERGFSFQSDGPLDMRMSKEGESAADFLNNASEERIADVLYQYGEEPKSRRVARAIVAARPIERTGQLAEIVRKALGHHAGMKKDPATRTFQAIRIYLNEELQELEGGLEAAEGC
jgi:16S rRNA (cytosine1402-N4)-methyltransferase